MRLELVCVLLCSLPSVTFAKESSQCPDGFLQHRNACYWFSNINGSFAEARSYCEFFRSHLAQITTKDENDFITAEANKTGRDHYRLGATDLMVRGTFLWEGGVALNYTNWDDGEPNNKEGQENCLEI
ncbi:perlucin-like [Haliotis rubra]|uniref:perlucin-like n=1 Tax=Haliotis rubra TaxID=36100 RepID=UPI001EE545F0|nr:perlucin-like [Haliotis rubra]